MPAVEAMDSSRVPSESIAIDPNSPANPRSVPYLAIKYKASYAFAQENIEHLSGSCPIRTYIPQITQHSHHFDRHRLPEGFGRDIFELDINKSEIPVSDRRRTGRPIRG